MSNATDAALPIATEIMSNGERIWRQYGLTKREEFAKAIMPTIIMLHDKDQTPADIAADAAFYADALLAELNKDARGRTLAREQPCGCLVCICESDYACHGCGAANCGKHPPGDFPNPLYEEPQP